MSRRQSGPATAKTRKRTITRQRMGVQDALWLEMDRPSNLMVVDSLMWTAEPIDWDRFVTVVRERLWDRFPVFRSVAVGDDDGDWYWEEHGGDTFESHLTRVRLPKPGGDLELQELVASQRTTPLDRSRPLWQMFCVDGFKGGSAVLIRTHHAIADGVRMVQLGMSLFDATPEGGAILAPAVRLHAAHLDDSPRPLLDQLRHEASALVEEVTELANGAAGVVGRAIADPGGVARAGMNAIGDAITEAGQFAGRTIEVAGTALTNPVGAAHGIVTTTAEGVEHGVRRLQSAMWPRLPGHGPLVDLLSSSPGDIDFARKLLFGTRNDPTYWTGEVGTRKVVAWSEPLPLDAVKQVARAHDATVNDVLVTCVAGTLHTYLTSHDSACASVNWMIPVNLKPLDHTLPEELGNSFAIVQLELPTDIADPLVVLDVVKRRMGRIKHGHEAGLAFRLQEVISGFSEVLYRAAVDLLANRAVGVLTNVPGPPMPVYIAGQRVEGMVGWAPLSGNQPMSFTIYSYDAKVFVGIACDAGLVPDHHQIVDGFADAFQRLSVAVR
jgi:diacylglycerol O-acyltransferase